MEDVLGGRSDPTRFAAFLADWEAILARRVDEAVAAFSAVDGLRGLVLAGGIGRGRPWPLSDIDFLTIHDDRGADVRAEIERRSAAMHTRWAAEGWWTGLNIGKLAFGRREVAGAMEATGQPLTDLLRDDRWYHGLDKGFRGRAVFDADAGAAVLARWLTDHRFSPSVVRFRLARERSEVEAASRRLHASTESDDALAATISLRDAGKWLQIWLLEHWGERDASLARVSTRFEGAARAHDRPDLIDAVNRLNDLDDASVARRMAAAPAWVWEWHDRAWRARRQVGEVVTARQHARDVLRVCALFQLRRGVERPFPVWLAIPAQVGEFEEKAALLAAILGNERFPD